MKISQEPAAVDSSALGPSVTQKKLCYNLGQDSHPSLCLRSSERKVPHIGVPERLLRGKNCVSLEKLCKGKILWPRVALSGRVIGSSEPRETKNPGNGALPTCQKACCTHSSIAHLLGASYMPGTMLRARTKGYGRKIFRGKENWTGGTPEQMSLPRGICYWAPTFLRLLDRLYGKQ